MTKYLIALPYKNKNGDNYCIDTDEHDYNRLIRDGVYTERVNMGTVRAAWPKDMPTPVVNTDEDDPDRAFEHIEQHW